MTVTLDVFGNVINQHFKVYAKNLVLGDEGIQIDDLTFYVCNIVFTQIVNYLSKRFSLHKFDNFQVWKFQFFSKLSR